jgi:hypothetical protein
MTTIVINAQNVFIGHRHSDALDTERFDLIMGTLQELSDAITNLQSVTAAEIEELTAVVEQVASQAPGVDFSPLTDKVNALAQSIGGATEAAVAAITTVPADGEPAPTDPPADPGAGDPPVDPAPPAPGGGEQPPTGDQPPVDAPPADDGTVPADPGAPVGDPPVDPAQPAGDVPPADAGTV